MKQKLLEEMVKKPIDPTTLLSVLQNVKEISPETLEQVLKSIETMSAHDLIELARNLLTLPLNAKERVMKKIVNVLTELNANTQAILLQEMLRASAGITSQLLSELVVSIPSHPLSHSAIVLVYTETCHISHAYVNQRIIDSSE
jgi:hypothetical protein